MTRPNLASLVPPRTENGIARISILQTDGETVDAELDRRAVLMFINGLTRQWLEAEERDARRARGEA